MYVITTRLIFSKTMLFQTSTGTGRMLLVYATDMMIMEMVEFSKLQGANSKSGSTQILPWYVSGFIPDTTRHIYGSTLDGNLYIWDLVTTEFVRFLKGA